MAIRITRANNKYLARVTPPHGGGIAWSTAEPLGANELIQELKSRGCHQTDIGDAFYEADEDWVLRLESGNGS